VIEIPGYRVIRPLGRGGMATVYLALQESVQREVALKVMSPTLLGDAQFGERFLREARIAAKLRHPHVVQVHDVGHAGDYHYIAMEYLPGGPALTRNGSPREPRFALRVTREIAGALGYAQNKGVVHRDIKPDNILLREDGAAVLTDFGIARASDNSRMTRTGAIIGTPHYMSPEQARGLPLDGRADLYSLGIVFHELILGRVPYQADDSLAVGIMHITAPLPRLPPHLSSLQSLLDRMLAKEPDQRFQSGAELAAAIERIERDLDGDPRDAPVFMPTRELSAVKDEASDRSEPVLGRIDDLLDSPPPRRPLDSRGREPSRNRARAAPARPPRKSGSRRWLFGALIVLLALGAAAWFNQDALRELMPQTRMNDLLVRADQALLENRLDGENGARELYAAALAIDPDSQTARQGLQRVGMRLLDSARSQLAANDVAAARASLARARELSVPAPEADALQRELDARESRGVELGALLDGAQQALREGRLDDGETSAVVLYRRALAAEPGNAIAAAGLRDTLTALLDRARALAAAGQYDEAAAQIEAVAAVDAAHLGLPDARARLAQAREERQSGLETQLDEADRLLKAGKLTAPAKANARDLYLAVLAQDASNARAKDGLRRIAATLLGQAQRQMADFEFESAASLLDRAQQVDAGVPGLAAARTRLRDLERSRSPAAADPQNAAATQARIAQLLAEARTAAEAGNLLAPPGDSAYDKYRAVRTLDPENAQARTGLAGLPALAKQRFEEALGANRLLTARGTIEALSTLAPADSALPDMRRRLARSLLGQAAEKLGSNELKRAREAFDQARELDPTNPDLASMQARLEQAGG
jgi:serine/threonine-protein kinase PpkA